MVNYVTYEYIIIRSLYKSGSWPWCRHTLMMLAESIDISYLGLLSGDSTLNII